MRKRTEIVAGVALMICGLLIAAGALEITLRLLPKGPAPIDDRPKLYFAAADAPTLQDFKVAIPRPSNTYRIAAVGDSFTFGPYLQFDDTYPKRMERWLNLNRPNQSPAVEVINYGVPRFSTFHEVGSVKKALMEGAQMILLQITLNDPEQKLDWPTELIPDATGHLQGSEASWFGNLKTIKFVMQRLENTRSQRLYREYFFKLFERDTPAYEKFQNAFSDIRKLCERYKVPLVAVIFPLFGVEVGDNYPFWPLHEQIRRDLAERSIEVFDISDAFRGLPVERLQVLPGFDRHPNEIGHRIAAEAILAELERRQLLPPGTYPTSVETRRIGINRANVGDSEELVSGVEQ